MKWGVEIYKCIIIKLNKEKEKQGIMGKNKIFNRMIQKKQIKRKKDGNEN